MIKNGGLFGPRSSRCLSAIRARNVPDLARHIKHGDLETIRQPLDFWGLNYYTPMRVSDDPAAVFPHVATAPAVKPEKTDIGWEIEPLGLSHVVRDLYGRYTLPEFYITENGAADNTDIENGAVSDTMRLDYISTHLSVAADLIAENYPLRGYFAWSLMDNYEWAEGYSMRFGIVHVDYDTQVRTIKQSGYWYRDLIAAHRGSDFLRRSGTTRFVRRSHAITPPSRSPCTNPSYPFRLGAHVCWAKRLLRFCFRSCFAPGRHLHLHLRFDPVDRRATAFRNCRNGLFLLVIALDSDRSGFAFLS